MALGIYTLTDENGRTQRLKLSAEDAERRGAVPEDVVVTTTVPDASAQKLAEEAAAEALAAEKAEAEREAEAKRLADLEEKERQEAAGSQKAATAPRNKSRAAAADKTPEL